MKFSLKSYVYFNAVPDGVYFRAGSDTLFVRGTGIYPLVSQVLRDLDGRHTVDEVTTRLPAKARDFAGTLIGQLHAKHMLQSAPDDHLDRIDLPCQQLYGDTLAYLKDAAGAYAEAFLRWRAQPLCVAGAGYSLKALLRALARSGVRELTICAEPEAAGRPGRDELEAALRAHALLDADFGYRFVDADGVDEALADRRLQCVYINDAAAPADTLLARLAAAGRDDALVAGVFDGRAVLGPDPRAGGATAADLLDRLRGGDDAPYPPVALSILGNLCAVELLAVSADIRRDGAPGRLGDRFLHVKPNGEISLHPLAASAGLAPRQPMQPDILAEPVAPEATGFARLRAALHGLLDPLAGLFQHERDHGLKNIPLFHACVRWHLPRRLGGGGGRAVRWGASQDQADSRALLAAAEQYARHCGAALGLADSADIVAETDRPRWREAALAQALLRSARFATDGVRYRVAAADVGDAALVTALRILALFTAGTPALAIDTLPGLPAFRATVAVDGRQAAAVAATAAEAMELALGEVISRLQAGDAAVDGGTAGAASVAIPAPPRAEPLELAGLALDRAFQIDPLLLSERFAVVEKPFLADATLGASTLVLGSISLVER